MHSFLRYATSIEWGPRGSRLMTIVGFLAAAQGLLDIDIRGGIAGGVFPPVLLVLTIFLAYELRLSLAHGKSVEAFASRGDIAAYVRSLVLSDIRTLSVFANTGQSTLEIFVTELRSIIDQQQFDRITVQILLRSPHNADLQRAERSEQSLKKAHALQNATTASKVVFVEHRYYSTTLPFRGVLAEHKSEGYSGFISFYDWSQRGSRSPFTTRDAANPAAFVIRKSNDQHALLDVYVSWFRHLWGRRNLHTLVFDFDDTLFTTTEAQIAAWLSAIRSCLG